MKVWIQVEGGRVVVRVTPNSRIPRSGVGRRDGHFWNESGVKME